MDLSDLSRMLHLGRGGAMLFLREHGAAACRDPLLNACAHDLRYDKQVDDSRAAYLFELAQETGEPAMYRDAVVAALDTAADAGLESEAGGLLVAFATHGDEEARRALYAAFDVRAARGDFAVGTGIVAADGLPGFLYTAKSVPAGGIDDVEPLVWALEEREGKEAAWAGMDAACHDRAWLSDLLALVRADRLACEGRRRRPLPPLPDYDTLRASVLAGDPGLYPRRLMLWGRSADGESLRRAADDLQREGDPRVLRAYVHMFRGRAFPDSPAPLLRLAHDADDKTRFAALDALGCVKDGAVRDLAFHLADDARWRAYAIRVLQASFEPGDESFVERLLRQTVDADDLHTQGFDLLELAEMRPDEEFDGALLLLYESEPCSMCRTTVVERLLRRGALPGWVAAECAYDASERTRRLVRDAR